MTAEAWFDIKDGEAWLGGQPVLRDLSLQLRLGESTTVLGPNGAGKSSLVKLIDRSLHPIVKPTAHLKLFGASTVNLWRLRRRLGVVTSELELRIPARCPAREVVQCGLFGSMRLGRDQVPSTAQRDHSDRLIQQLDLQSIAGQLLVIRWSETTAVDRTGAVARSGGSGAR